MVIADQLNKHDIVAFSMLLSQAVQIDTNSEEPLSWQVSRLILEWKKTNKDYPRRALVKLLLEAAATSDNNLKLVQEQKDRFKQIARKLDIQCKEYNLIIIIYNTGCIITRYLVF